MKRVTLSILLFSVLSVTGCGPSEGSPEWCEKMKNKPQSEWTVNETQIFADKCLGSLFKMK